MEGSRRHVLRTWMSSTVVLAGLALGACGGSVVVQVDDGVYGALVPSPEQLATVNARDIPGGFVELRDAGIDQIGLRIEGDEVTFQLDGSEAITRRIVDRLVVTDSEGSGPFKAKKQVLVLGDQALVLGDLVVDEPVIWPGTFEESPVITLKSRNLQERGPDVSCRSDERCLLLTSGDDPVGRYENINNPELDESPVASIEVAGEFVEFTLETGRQVRVDRGRESFTLACGLSETVMWEVPAEIGLDMDDPVLVHTVCPSTPGGSIGLIVIERAKIPVLAPLGIETDGNWCMAGPDCLWFAPT